MRVSGAILLIVLLTGCATYQQVQRLDSIASLQPTSSGVKVVTIPSMGVGVPEDRSIELAEGNEALFGDGYHVSIRLKYLGFSDGRYHFRYETLNRPPGEAVEINVEYLAVPAYGAKSTKSPSVIDSP